MGDFNYNYFNRQGTLEATSFDFNADQWSTRLTSKFKLPGQIDFEVIDDQLFNIGPVPQNDAVGPDESEFAYLKLVVDSLEALIAGIEEENKWLDAFDFIENGSNELTIFGNLYRLSGLKEAAAIANAALEAALNS